MKLLGDRLKQIRVKAGLMQKDMANLLGLKLPGYNRIEKGKVEITLKHLIVIQKRFDISLDWLVSGKEAVRFDCEGFGDFTGSIRQMLDNMRQDPGFLHGMLSSYHELKEKYDTSGFHIKKASKDLP